jgi:hypothetical protein
LRSDPAAFQEGTGCPPPLAARPPSAGVLPDTGAAAFGFPEAEPVGHGRTEVVLVDRGGG